MLLPHTSRLEKIRKEDFWTKKTFKKRRFPLYPSNWKLTYFFNLNFFDNPYIKLPLSLNFHENSSYTMCCTAIKRFTEPSTATQEFPLYLFLSTFFLCVVVIVVVFPCVFTLLHTNAWFFLFLLRCFSYIVSHLTQKQFSAITLNGNSSSKLFFSSLFFTVLDVST